MGQPSEPAFLDPQSLRKKALGDAAGHVLARALHLANELRLAEQFGEDAAASAAIAGHSGCDAEAMYRLLHYLARHGYFEELTGKSFRLTPLGRMLRQDAPDNTAAVIASLGHPGVWDAFGRLGEAVRTALPPAHRRGRELYAKPESETAARSLADSMIGYHAKEPPRIAARYDFSASSLVVDVGGSSGRLLIAILSAHPHLTGVIFDRPGIEPEARAALAAAGLSDRCTFVAGSFFDGVPEGADTYILSHILHDWSAGEAADILLSCRRAMRADSRLLIIEAFLAPDGSSEDELPADMMLLANTQGRLRGSEEMAVLLENSWLGLVQVTQIAPTVSVLEARPVAEGRPLSKLAGKLATMRKPR